MNVSERMGCLLPSIDADLVLTVQSNSDNRIEVKRIALVSKRSGVKEPQHTSERYVDTIFSRAYGNVGNQT